MPCLILALFHGKRLCGLSKRRHSVGSRTSMSGTQEERSGLELRFRSCQPQVVIEAMGMDEIYPERACRGSKEVTQTMFLRNQSHLRNAHRKRIPHRSLKRRGQ